MSSKRVGVLPLQEHAHVQQRCVDLQLDHDEQRHRQDRDGEQRDDRARRPAPGAAFLEGEQQRGQRRRDGGEAPPVEPPGPLGGELRQHEHRGERTEDADGQVDEEDQPPVHVLDEVTADHRAERGGEDDPQPVHAHGLAELVLRHQRVDHRQRDRGQHAARDRLHDAERDERVQAPREAAQHRAGREQHERDGVDALHAEPQAEPGADRHHHALGEGVGGGDPLHLVGGGAEVPLDVDHGDVDDRGVQDRHEHAGDQHQHRDDPPAVPADPAPRAVADATGRPPSGARRPASAGRRRSSVTIVARPGRAVAA